MKGKKNDDSCEQGGARYRVVDDGILEVGEAPAEVVTMGTSLRPQDVLWIMRGD